MSNIKNILPPDGQLNEEQLLNYLNNNLYKFPIILSLKHRIVKNTIYFKSRIITQI